MLTPLQLEYTHSETKEHGAILVDSASPVHHIYICTKNMHKGIIDKCNRINAGETIPDGNPHYAVTSLPFRHIRDQERVAIDINMVVCSLSNFVCEYTRV